MTRRDNGIVVLGMHRSGTSFVTSALQSAGFRLGDNLLGASEANQGGHFEDLAFVRLNDEILRYSGGTWDAPPNRVTTSLSLRLRMREFVHCLTNNLPYALKDPRIVITWSAWRHFVGNPDILVCFRNPLAVARSLEKRDGFPIERGLALWKTYNERVLETVRAERSVVYFNFDDIVRSAPNFVALIRRFGKLASADVLAESFQEDWKHHSGDGESILESCAPVYAELMSRWQGTLPAHVLGCVG